MDLAMQGAGEQCTSARECVCVFPAPYSNTAHRCPSPHMSGQDKALRIIVPPQHNAPPSPLPIF